MTGWYPHVRGHRTMHQAFSHAAVWFDRLNRLLAVLAGTFMVLITLGIAWVVRATRCGGSSVGGQ